MGLVGIINSFFKTISSLQFQFSGSSPISMATRDDHLVNQSKDSRRSFLDNTNRKKVNDGNSQRLGRASSSGRSTGPRTLPLTVRTRSATICPGESSQVTNPALGTTMSSTSRDLTGSTQQHQSDKVKMKKDSTPLVKKSGNNAISVSRIFKKKESTTQPHKDDTSLLKKKGTGQPLKDPAGLAKKGETSGIGTSIPITKKVEKTVESDRNSKIMASKQVMQKREKAQQPQAPVGLVKNIGTSISSTSTPSVQKNKAICLPKDSAPSVKKIETTTSIPTRKQLVQKKEKNQPSKGSADAMSKGGTSRTLPPKPVTRKKGTTSDNPRQKQHVCKDHIVWEGFVDRIVPLEKSCQLCDGDLANNPEYDPNMENLNPAENAVLSCGHVFHSSCLRLTITEDNCRDPPCIVCGSFFS